MEQLEVQMHHLEASLTETEVQMSYLGALMSHLEACL